jgi:hypothetical protein
MKRTILFATAASLLLMVPLSCNPDCQSLANVRITTPVNSVGNEILIVAEPLSGLEGRKVFFGSKEAAETRFIPNLGLAARIPTGTPTNAEVRIEDPDCLDVISMPLQVVNDSYYASLDNFVPPAPPDIVIPVVPISFPTSVDNAWLSPVNPGYCLWFTMFKDTVAGVPHELSLVDPGNSFEQSTCCCERGDPDLPYAQNRMGGIVDRANNRIEIYVDRRPRGGDIEEFTGMFIDRATTAYASSTGLLNCPVGSCLNAAGATVSCAISNASPPPVEDNMMLLTSKKTGRQIVVFQLKL